MTRFGGDADGQLYVAVVNADQIVRYGLAALLQRDSRLHVMDPVARVTDLQELGLHFDVCFLDLAEISGSDDMTELLHSAPSVVYTSAKSWAPWIAAWVSGARGVVGRNVASVPLADAAWDAVFRPCDVQPQLARALLEGTAEVGLSPSSGLVEVLGRVAEGRRVPSVLATSGIPASAYENDVRDLRALCEKAGLGRLPVAPAGEAGHAFEPSVLPPEAVALSSRVREVLRHYADGYSYEEIAALLRIEETTVKTHVLNALDKFGITSHRSSEVRLLFAIYLSGRHRRPDLIRRRLDQLATACEPPARSRILSYDRMRTAGINIVR